MTVNQPNKIILHCAVTEDKGDRYGAKDINEWHKERGFKDDATGIHTGYHYVIRRSGVVESYTSDHPCRPEYSVGAHCRGHNTHSLGVVFMMTKIMTDMQWEAWMILYQSARNRLGIVIDQVRGHNEYNDHKTCPNLNMNFIRLIMARELST